MVQIPLIEGRRVFGSDPQTYAWARPEYPESLYTKLVERCGLRKGTSIFEVGSGTGLATQKLLALGAGPLYAVEPDPRLAAYLKESIQGSSLHVEQSAFEEVRLVEESFDLGVAATSFHWLEQATALAKARRLLRTGGWWAMWWTQCGDRQAGDAFYDATTHLFAGTPDSPSKGSEGGVSFSLDYERRIADLTKAGFTESSAETWKWAQRYDTARLVALYSTFSTIKVLDVNRRERLLGELAEIIEHRFGGAVDYRFITTLYTAKKP